VARAFDLVGISNTEGCPVLRVLCEGREPAMPARRAGLSRLPHPFARFWRRVRTDHRHSRLRNWEGDDPSTPLRAMFHSCRIGVGYDERADPAQPPPTFERTKAELEAVWASSLGERGCWFWPCVACAVQAFVRRRWRAKEYVISRVP
jgi:hypothetical protein